MKHGASGGWRWAAAVALLAVAAYGQDEDAPGPGRWRLSTDGERYSLWANAAPMEEVLDGIQRLASGPIRIKQARDAKVSARFFNVRLDELLARLGIEYFLLFERDGDEAYALQSGWVGYDPDRKAAAPAPFPALHGLREAPAGAAALPEAARAKIAGGAADGDHAGVVYRAPYPVHIRLDGDTTDWPEGAEWQRVTHTMGPEPATNDVDASFDVAGVSDGTNLYLGVRITDDLKSVTNATRLPLSRDDTLQLLLTGADGTSTVRFAMNRHHVLLAKAGAAGLPARQYVSQNSGTYAVIADGDKGWALEIAVPLALLGADPASRRAVSFNLILRDRDAGRTNQNTLVWSRAARAGDLARPGRLEFVNIR